MEGPLWHEEIFRSGDVMRRIAAARVVLCGTGAVGSNLAHNLVRQGFLHLTVIDRDRVETSNISTQTYRKADVGAQKATALKNDLFRISGVEVHAVATELTDANARKLLAGAQVVVDGFDNSASRARVGEACRAAGIACLHVGLAADYAEVMWDEHYRVPSAAGEDVCDYPLARNLVMLATTVASEVLVAKVALDRRTSYTITLGDFAIQPHTPADS